MPIELIPLIFFREFILKRNFSQKYYFITCNLLTRILKINLQVINTSTFLRSHDVTFTIGDKAFQEVVGHEERIGGNDEVCQINNICIFLIYLFIYLLM